MKYLLLFKINENIRIQFVEDVKIVNLKIVMNIHQKKYCSDNVLSTKLFIEYPHNCIQTPCNMNCEKI